MGRAKTELLNSPCVSDRDDRQIVLERPCFPLDGRSLEKARRKISIRRRLEPLMQASLEVRFESSHCDASGLGDIHSVPNSTAAERSIGKREAVTERRDERIETFH